MQLRSAAEALFEVDLAGRVLSFDRNAAHAFSQVAVQRRRMGRPITQADAQIAAIVREHGAKLATRNAGDFRDCGIEVIDPWRF